MYIFAYICILFALLCSIGGGGLALFQLWHGKQDSYALTGGIQLAITAALMLASAILLHALFWQDYSLEYVASYTDSYLPVFYRLTAFWAGQPGSMLFWALITAICGSLFWLTPTCRRLNKNTGLWFWTFFYCNTAFFCLILSCWNNPFILQTPVPADGNGLNPLLQNPGMIFHPPLLFMGYAGFCVPACLALAQCLSCNEGDLPWYRQTRPFIMLAWILLTAGIVLGAWWAYMELGWGGYWAWDPVENASLLPWLAATACLHIMAVQSREGKLSRTCASLMALTVVLAFFATYLTRSGVIQSVHAFGDGGVGTPLLIFVITAFLISMLCAFAAPGRGEPLASPFSREGALVLVAWIFLALAAIIMIATLWPVLCKIFAVTSQGLDASFYNRVCLPPAVLLLALLGICTWLGWQGGFAGKQGAIKFYVSCAAFLAGCAAVWFAGYRQPLPMLATGAAVAVLCSVLINALSGNIWNRPRAISALGAHLGLALLALGVAFSGPYKIEKDVMLAKGESASVGPCQITLQNVVDGRGQGFDYLGAQLKIVVDGSDLGIISPERRIYDKFGSMQFSEVDVISSLGRDIYASMLGMDENMKVLVRISIEPLVSWIWIGGALMSLLPLFGIASFRRRTIAARQDRQ